jgi:hypothetical protein
VERASRGDADPARLNEEDNRIYENLRATAPERYIVKNPWNGELMNILEFEQAAQEVCSWRAEPEAEEVTPDEGLNGHAATDSNFWEDNMPVLDITITGGYKFDPTRAPTLDQQEADGIN